MGGGSCTSRPNYGPKDRRREYNRLRAILPAVLVIQTATMTFALVLTEPAVSLTVLASIVAVLGSAWRKRRAVKADEADTEHRKY